MARPGTSTQRTSTRTSITRRIGGFFRDHLSDQAILGRSFSRRDAVSTFARPEEWFLRLFGAETKAGRRVGDANADQHSAVYACVDLLAKTVGSLPVKLYRRRPDGREPLDDHPASRLLRLRPHEAQTPMLFRAHGQRCIGLRGNFYARIHRDAFFAPSALVPLDPATVQPVLAAGQRLRFRISGTGAALVPGVDLLHVPWIHGDGWVGKSPVTCMREAIGLALSAEEFGARFFANDSRPPGLLTTEQKLDPEQIKVLREMWQESQTGANRHKTGVVHSGLKYQPISLSNEDAQFLETRKFQVEEVARFYGVPLALLQSTEKSTSWGTGISELVQGFVKFTITPIVTQWEQALGLALLTEDEIADGLYFRFELGGLLRGDMKARSEALKIQRENGIISANEWRRLEELDDLPDALGDIYLQPLNYAPVGSPAARGERSAASAPAPAAASESESESEE